MGDKPNVWEKTVLDLIGSYKPDDISRAVSSNMSLAGMVMKEYPVLVKTARMAAGLFRNKSGEMNVDNILKWLALTRPDLHSAIMLKKENITWLKKQINDIKRLLWG